MNTNSQPASPPSIEDIVLQHDQRGISQLRAYLPTDNFWQTAAFALARKRSVMIATGFYVNGIAETDGPPGALALAEGFHRLGSDVTLVSDRYCLPLLQNASSRCSLVDFPITGEDESQAFARDLIEKTRPTLLIAIERCGKTHSGAYRNMRGVDLTPYTARLDYLFEGRNDTIGIGDGGNEIGMGLVYEQVAARPALIREPTVTATSHLLIATVSNWAAYGLLAAMSLIRGEDLLPSVTGQSRLLHKIVALGATNGVNGRVENLVDGFSEEVNDGILEELQAYVTLNKKAPRPGLEPGT